MTAFFYGGFWCGRSYQALWLTPPSYRRRWGPHPHHDKGCQWARARMVSIEEPSHWRDPLWLKQGVILDMAQRRKVVTADASNRGWGAPCECKPTCGLWSEKESGLHINCLEILPECQACQFFLPDIWGHHVLVCSDSRSGVSYTMAASFRSESAR